MKKYVGFIMPTENWDHMDWLYNLIEDRCRKEFDFYLVTAATPDSARALVLEVIYKKAMREGGVEYVVEDALSGLGYLDMTNEEVLEYLGAKDGKIALGFFEKYTYDVFQNDEIDFFNGFAREDQDKFYDFDAANLKKLYFLRRKGDILIAPITKELTELREGGKK